MHILYIPPWWLHHCPGLDNPASEEMAFKTPPNPTFQDKPFQDSMGSAEERQEAGEVDGAADPAAFPHGHATSPMVWVPLLALPSKHSFTLLEIGM